MSGYSGRGAEISVNHFPVHSASQKLRNEIEEKLKDCAPKMMINREMDYEQEKSDLPVGDTTVGILTSDVGIETKTEMLASSSQTEVETTSDESQSVLMKSDNESRTKSCPGEIRITGSGDTCEKTVLTMQHRDFVQEVDTPLEIRRNSPVCRHPILVGDIVLEACIDSGATVCLMSRRAYWRIRHIVGPLVDSDKRACAANGGSLELDGYARVSFRLKTATYTFGFRHIMGLHL